MQSLPQATEAEAISPQDGVAVPAPPTPFLSGRRASIGLRKVDAYPDRASVLQGRTTPLNHPLPESRP
ncbi:protein of unknown function [Sterolibacterium denitrificans]|uniref:Uncharacterized protein n=1 Tax=Sterolibacterium denitrificans TaxID=157592 RepID=A0A7Z7HS49_9PROT|nr:protein of unknown function [Sterolibacterium denitrificans]